MQQQMNEQPQATAMVAQDHGPFHIDYDVTIDGEPTVNARELHAFLEISTRFNDWIARQITEYGFIAGQDFYSEMSKTSSGGRPSKQYYISFDMGKELSMVEKTPKGKEARKFFIESDKRRRELEAAPAPLSGPELMAAALIEANQTIQQAQLQIAQKDAQLRTQAPLVESYRAHYSMEEVENFDAFADRWGFKNGPLTQVCEERGYLSKASKYRPNDVSLEPGEEPTAELGIFRSKRVKTGTGDNQKQRVHATIICGKSPDLARLVLYRFGRDAFAKPKRKSDTRQTDKFNELCAELKAMRDDGYDFDNRLITGMQVHPDIGYWAEHGTIEGVDDLGQVELQAHGSKIRPTPPHCPRGLGTGAPRRHGQTKAYPPMPFPRPLPPPSTPDRGREPSYTPPDPRVTRILGNQSPLVWLAGAVGGNASDYSDTNSKL